VVQDFAQSLNHFETAAHAGHPDAAGNLGLMYLQGVGTEQDNATALEWLRIGAEGNSALALNALGHIYLHGMGAPKNLTKSVEYFQAAAKLDFVEAKFNLGSLYYDGVGVTKDHVKAKEYFLACGKEHPFAAYNLGVMAFSEGDPCAAASHWKVVSEIHSNLQIAHGDVKHDRLWPAFLEYLLAAEMGVELAVMNAAYIIETQLIPERLEWPEALRNNTDLLKVLKHIFRIAAAQRNPEAATRMGEFANADGDEASAESQFNLALQYDDMHPRAMYNLASLHQQQWMAGGDESSLHKAQALHYKAMGAPWPHSAPAYLASAVLQVQAVVASVYAWLV